ncbi:MAG: type II toxin-antitoxin system VapC family toxin [Nitrospira sp.]|nr:type II toxin-antitoxin system VapC family toxin [Nitrospira sp.]
MLSDSNSFRQHLITSTIVLYEVYKKIKRERGEEMALQLAGRLHATHVIPLTESSALLAADLSLQHGLAMADAMVYATGRDQEVEVVTGDADLEGLPGVVYIK